MRLAGFDAVIRALSAANVRYLVAGGVAVSAHGYIRRTTAIELEIAIGAGHIQQAFRALDGIGYRPTEAIDADIFARSEHRKNLRQDNGIQVLNFQSETFASTPLGVPMYQPFDFEREYYAAMRTEILPGLEVRFLSIPALIRMKQSAGCPRDRDDIQHLRWLQEDFSHIDENDEEFLWSMTTFEGARKMQLIRTKKLSVRKRLESLDELSELCEHFQKLRHKSALKPRAGTKSEAPVSRARPPQTN